MKRALYALLFIVGLVAIWFLHLLWSAGQLNPIEPHFAGTCEVVGGVVGAEDITIDRATGLAYISTCDRRAIASGQEGNGAIFTYVPGGGAGALRSLVSGPDFQPHGISFWSDPQGDKVLFVVNHSGGRQSVEIYDVRADGLVHRETVSDPALRSPNDVVGVSRDAFYVTNDHHFRPGVMRLFEDYLQLSMGSVQYFDGRGFHEVASGLGYANGVNISPDGRTVYVSETVGRELSVFDRDPQSGALTLARVIPMDTGPDNIEIGPGGGLWIGAHPQLLTYVAYAKDGSKHAPAQILRVDLRAAGEPRVDAIYLSRGEELSGASVGAVAGDRLLMGSIFDDRLLDCRMAQ